MKRILVILAAFTAIGALQACGGNDNTVEPQNESVAVGSTEPGAMTLGEAADQGLATVTANGVDLTSIDVTVTVNQPLQLTLPAGLLFTSGDSNAQSMMVAKTTTLALQGSPGAPTTSTINVPTYCVNYHLEIPTSSTGFTIAGRDSQRGELSRLAACLEDKPGSHEMKQFAIWAVSDKVANMTADEYVADALKHAREKLEAEGVDQFTQDLKARFPDISQEYLDQLRQLPPNELSEVFDVAIAQGEPAIRRSLEVRRRSAKPLLAACGYNVASLTMFKDI